MAVFVDRCLLHRQYRRIVREVVGEFHRGRVAGKEPPVIAILRAARETDQEDIRDCARTLPVG